MQEAHIDLDFRMPDGTFTQASLLELLPQGEVLNNYDFALIDLELYDIKDSFQYHAEDLAGGTKVLPYLRLHAPWLPVIGLSKLFHGDADYFIAVGGSFGFDGHFPKLLFELKSFNKIFWDGVVERAELLRKKATLGPEFTGPNMKLQFVVSTKNVSRLNDNFPNWRGLIQTLFYFSDQVALEPVGEGYSGATTIRAIAVQSSVLENTNSEWLVKISTNPFKLHLESQAHFKMLRSGLEYARMVPLLWSDVVVVDHIGAIVYQFASGTTVAIDMAKDLDGAMSLCTRLVPLLEKMYASAKRGGDRGVIGNLVKEWFTLDKLKPAIDEFKHIPLCDELSELCSPGGEEKSILSAIASYKKCFVHGDLHLRNILLGDRDILIDFAKSGSGPIAVDIAKLCSDMALNINEMRENRFPYWEDDSCLLNKYTSRIRSVASFEKDDKKLYNIFLLCNLLAALTYDSTSPEVKKWIKSVINIFSLD